MTGTTSTVPTRTAPPTAASPQASSHAAPDEHAAYCSGCLDRRQLLQRAGGVGLAAAGVALLAACGSGSTGSKDGSGAAATGGADGSLAQVADVPVGGSLLVESGGEKILLVQATSGTITAFSAVCPHQGCTVIPADSELQCPCHNSMFGLDGARLSGPAKDPLPAVEVHVMDGAVFAGTA